MKKINKVLSSILLITLIPLSMGSCTTETVDHSDKINAVLNETEPQYIFGRDLNITYTLEDNDYLDELETEINKIVAEGIEKYSTLENKIKEFNNIYDKLGENYHYLEVYRYATNDEKYISLDEECYEAYNNAQSFAVSFEYNVGKSKYRNNYYSHYSETEIDEYLDSLNPEKSSAKAIYESKRQKLENSYYNNEISIIDFYKGIKEIGTNLALASGYKDYLSYSYKEEYGRNYSYESANKIYDFIIEYLIPLRDKYINEYKSLWNNASQESKNEFNNILDNFLGPYKKYFDSYAESLGEEYNSFYTNLWKSGNYFFSNIDDSIVTAFNWNFYDNTSFLFFSKNYQDIRAFSHEFGHYISSYLSGNESFDICEIQSHAQEILFAYYLKEYTDFDKTAAELYLSYRLQYFLKYLIYYYSIGLMENYIYTVDDLNYYETLGYYQTISTCLGISVYDSLEDSYLGNVSIGSINYYMSYYTTSISAFSIYPIIVNQGYDKAIDIYNEIIRINKNYSYEEACFYTGIFNAFNIDDYVKLYNSLI